MLQLLIRTLIFPIIKEKVEDLASKLNLPFLTKLKYNALNTASEKIIVSITELADKIIDDPYSAKNELRLTGLNIALDILETVAEKFNKTVSEIRNKIELIKEATEK